ncbi:MAG: HEAT repeat domain-containing protein [Acidimicrobiia bacterium]
MTRSLLVGLTGFEATVVTVIAVGCLIGLTRRTRAQRRITVHAQVRTALVMTLGASQPQFEATLIDDLMHLSTRERTDLLVGVATPVGPTERGHLTWLAERLGLLDRATRRLRSQLARRRLHALAVFAALQVDCAESAALLDDSHPEVRAAAAWTWHLSHPDDDAAPVLLPLAEDVDGRVRHVVAEILARRGANGCAVASRLLQTDSSRARTCALMAATRLATPELCAAVVTAANDANAQERVLAIRALAHQGSPAAAEKVVQLLPDPDPQVRGEAAGALPALLGAPALAHLGPCTGDDDARVQFAAAAALMRLGPVGQMVLSAGPNASLLTHSSGATP